MSFPESTNPNIIEAEVDEIFGVTNVLLEANNLVNGSRAQAYGDPAENWKRTAEIASALLNCEISPAEAVLFAIAMKLARLSRDPSHRDSTVDLAGYAWVLDKVVRR
jgi:hypothetical protein